MTLVLVGCSDSDSQVHVLLRTLPIKKSSTKQMNFFVKPLAFSPVSGERYPCIQGVACRERQGQEKGTHCEIRSGSRVSISVKMRGYCVLYCLASS